MSLPVVTSVDPTISWVDPTVDANGNPLTATNTPNGYLVGIRDLADAAHSAGNYAATFLVSGGSATSCTCAQAGFTSLLVPGHSYGAAAEAEVGTATPPLFSKWATEYQFVYQPAVPPGPPTGFTVA